MTAIYPATSDDDLADQYGTKLIACNHCGIVALNTPAFGWRRWFDEDGVISHHCPAAVQYNEYVAQGLVHMKAPDEAIIYEDPEHWAATLVGAHDD